MSRHKYVPFPQQLPNGATTFCEYCGAENTEKRRECIPIGTVQGSNKRKCHSYKLEEKVPEASYWLHIGKFRGNAIAVSETMLLCALHRQFEVGESVELIDVHGVKRTGKIIKSIFEVNKFDLTLIQIDAGQPPLPFYIPVHRKLVECCQNITIIGLVTGLDGGTILATQTTQVFAIERNGSLFRTTYYDVDSFCGAGIMVVSDNERYELVGVYVGTYNGTQRLPTRSTIEGSKITGIVDSEKNADFPLSNRLHSLNSFCLASEPIRTKEIFELLPIS